MKLGEDAHDQGDPFLVVALRLLEDLDQVVAQLSHDQVVLYLVVQELPCLVVQELPYLVVQALPYLVVLYQVVLYQVVLELLYQEVLYPAVLVLPVHLMVLVL